MTASEAIRHLRSDPDFAALVRDTHRAPAIRLKALSAAYRAGQASVAKKFSART